MKKFYQLILLFSAALSIFLLWTLFQSGILYVLWNYAFSSSYRDLFSYDLHHLAPGASFMTVARTLFDEYIWESDLFLQKCCIPFSVVIPLITSLGALELKRENDTIARYAAYRSGNKCGYFLKRAIIISSRYSVSFTAAAFVFFAFINTVSKGTFYGNVGCRLFLDILPNGFYYSHPYLYWTMNYLIRFCIIPFIYSMFSCGFCLCVSAYSTLFMIPNLCYFGLSIAGNGLLPYIHHAALYISPYLLLTDGGVFIFTDYRTIPILIIQIILPLVFSLSAIVKSAQYAEI